MVAYEVSDLALFTKELFSGSLFSDFLTVRADITTFCTFSIDGRLRREYYDTDEQEDLGMSEYATWKKLRPICYNLIKGRKLPVYFQIDLRLSEYNLEQFINKHGIYRGLLSSCYLNIRYSGMRLCCISGCSVKDFIMDTDIFKLWDQEVKLYIERYL